MLQLSDCHAGLRGGEAACIGQVGQLIQGATPLTRPARIGRRSYQAALMSVCLKARQGCLFVLLYHSCSLSCGLEENAFMSCIHLWMQDRVVSLYRSIIAVLCHAVWRRMHSCHDECHVWMQDRVVVFVLLYHSCILSCGLKENAFMSYIHLWMQDRCCLFVLLYHSCTLSCSLKENAFMSYIHLWMQDRVVSLYCSIIAVLCHAVWRRMHSCHTFIFECKAEMRSIWNLTLDRNKDKPVTIDMRCNNPPSAWNI